MTVRDLRFKRRHGLVWWLGVILFIFIALSIGGGYAAKSWLAKGRPALSGALAIPGLSAPVALRRDGDGLVSIKAENTLDAYRALGFAHAQDRLFQMEMMRRLGSGRVAEILGGIEGVLRVDRFMRTLGLRRKAESDWAQAGPQLRAVVTAYAEGVNAFLSERVGPLPIEFQLLQIEPERWLPVDSMIWGQLMALQLSGNWTTEAQRARLLQALSADQVEKLFLDPPADSPITLPASARTGAAAAPAPAQRSNIVDPKAAAVRLASLIDDLPPLLTPPGASNAWVVAGDKTASGKPVLANDPHLGLTAPSQWHLVRMEAPGFTRVGATTPGVPLLVIGHNDSAAWGFTTTHSDTMDFVIEKTDPTDPRAYVTPGGPKLYDVRTEVIGVRWGDDEVLEVRSSRHGPIVTDIDSRSAEVLAPYRGEAGEAELEIALAWPALSETNRIADALLAANAATDWDAFRDAFRLAGSPQQNIFYADVAGRIGMISPALVPLRDGYDGAWPVAGWTRDRIWSGFAPFETLPQTIDPAEGVIYNGNNRVLGPDAPLFLTGDFVAHYRAARIEQMLKASIPDHDSDDSARIQLDTLSLAAQELTPLLVSAARAGAAIDPRANDVLAQMEGWTGDMLAEAAEPAIFAAWTTELHRLLLLDDLGEEPFEGFNEPRFYVLRDSLRGVAPWCDDVGTEQLESCADQAAAALDRALADLDERFDTTRIEDWRWGALHVATFSHPVFNRLPVLRGMLGGPQVETGGGDHTVNRGSHRSTGARAYTHAHGPGLRAIFDLADLNAARFMIGTGQSGDPLSPHFDDMAERWRDGRWVDLAPSRFVSAPVFTLAPKR